MLRGSGIEWDLRKTQPYDERSKTFVYNFDLFLYFSGVMLRGSGIEWDLRKTQPFDERSKTFVYNFDCFLYFSDVMLRGSVKGLD
jgi:NADH:ubiquinone oxidoreductase subunit D